MNKRKIRAVKARLNRNAERLHSSDTSAVRLEDLHILTAYHEAGHAVAACILAHEFGYSPHEIIGKIEIHGEWEEGKYGAATTLTYSREIWDYIIPIFNRVAEQKSVTELGPPMDYDEVQEGIVAEAIANARTEGVDVDAWLRAYSVRAAMGPVAQELLLKSVDDNAFLNFGAKADLTDLSELYRLSDADDEFTQSAENAVRQARAYLKREDVRQAIESLANYLIKHGNFDSATAVRLIFEHLKPD